MVDTDLRRNHRSSARPAADSIACRMDDWRPSQNSSSPPTFPAALADAFSHGHVQSVVLHQIEINPVDSYARTGGWHANHSNSADRSDPGGITGEGPRNLAEARCAGW